MCPGSGPGTPQGVALRFQPQNANPAPQIEGQDPQPGIVNYFTGNDPMQWHTNISTYARVVYHAIYPGIDLAYYGTQGQLEYDYVVAPGTDPGVILLSIAGTQSLHLATDGSLLLTTNSGELRQAAPVIYQEVAGARQLISGGYMLLNDHEVRFTVGTYDRNKDLIIDPVLSYSTYLGGSSNESGNALARDGRGNVYVTGYTYSPAFPTTSLTTTFGGGSDAFVTKLNATGTAKLYSTYFGGGRNDAGKSIALDGVGNVYVTGDTYSADFPVILPYQSTFHNTACSYVAGGICPDAFVTKLNTAGNALLYSTYLGGSGVEQAQGIAVGSDNSIYVTGGTNSPDFPVVNALQSNAHGTAENAFVTKLQADGSPPLYST